MKILIISGHFKNWDAGASGVCLNLDAQMRKLGHESCLLNAEDYDDKKIPQAINRIIISSRVQRRALSLAKKQDVVEVAGNLGWRLFQSLRALPDATRPLLVTRLHGLEFKDEQVRFDEEIAGHLKLPSKYKAVTRHWVNYQEQKSIALADIVVCLCSRDVDAIVTSGLKAESQVMFVPSGCEERYLTARTYPAVATKLLWWGSWVERKGIFTLPHAFDLACRRNPDLTLTLGGTGTEPEQVLAQFPPSVRARVKVLPFVSREEHQEILRTHEIFLFPSLSEGFGIALLEAMAASMPCIATLTGMGHDWLEHGRNSFIVPMNGPTALARAIERLSQDADLRAHLGREAQQTARGLTWDNFGTQMSALYARAMAQRHSDRVPVP